MSADPMAPADQVSTKARKIHRTIGAVNKFIHQRPSEILHQAFGRSEVNVEITAMDDSHAVRINEAMESSDWIPAGSNQHPNSLKYAKMYWGVYSDDFSRRLENGITQALGATQYEKVDFAYAIHPVRMQHLEVWEYDESHLLGKNRTVKHLREVEKSTHTGPIHARPASWAARQTLKSHASTNRKNSVKMAALVAAILLGPIFTWPVLAHVHRSRTNLDIDRWGGSLDLRTFPPVAVETMIVLIPLSFVLAIGIPAIVWFIHFKYVPHKWEAFLKYVGNANVRPEDYPDTPPGTFKKLKRWREAMTFLGAFIFFTPLIWTVLLALRALIYSYSLSPGPAAFAFGVYLISTALLILGIKHSRTLLPKLFTGGTILIGLFVILWLWPSWWYIRALGLPLNAPLPRWGGQFEHSFSMFFDVFRLLVIGVIAYALIWCWSHSVIAKVFAVYIIVWTFVVLIFNGVELYMQGYKMRETGKSEHMLSDFYPIAACMLPDATKGENGFPVWVYYTADGLLAYSKRPDHSVPRLGLGDNGWPDLVVTESASSIRIEPPIRWGSSAQVWTFMSDSQPWVPANAKELALRDSC